MRDLGDTRIHPRASKRTTVPDPGAPSRPDLLRRDFTSPVPTAKLVGDIAYLGTGEGWPYPAVVIGLCTRMVVGWAMAEHMRASLCVDAPRMACGRGYVAEGAISRSDRGSQHASRLPAEWAREHDVRLSAGRRATCYDNAVAESFFGTLKNEMRSLRAWPTRAEAKHAVMGYVEGYYNRRQPHSTIGHQIPARRMESFSERTKGCPRRPERPSFRVRKLDTVTPA